MCDGSCLRRSAGGDRQHPVLFDRREFVTGVVTDVAARSLLAAIASALATGALGCGNGIIGGNAPTAPPPLGNTVVIRLSDFPQLAAVGGIARVNVTNAPPIAVAHTGTDTFVAVSLVCTHQGTTVSVTANGFQCPNHGATFAIDGHWVGGQPTTNLVTYPVTYDKAAGTLQINGTPSAPGGAGPSTDD